MGPTLVPRGQEITFDFTPIAGKSKALEWGAHQQGFTAREGNVMMTTVASFPLGAVLVENVKTNEVYVESVVAGKGAEVAGMRAGDILTAVTAVAVPKAANLVKEPVGAVYVLNPSNPRLFPEVMDALTSNAEGNGGYGKAILVFERSAQSALDEEKSEQLLESAAPDEAVGVTVEGADFAQ